MGDKANTLRMLNRLEESFALFEAALVLGRQVFTRDSDDLLVLEENMARTLSELGNHEEAAEVFKRCIKARERSPRYGPSHETTWSDRASLGRALVELGRFSEAVPLLRDSLAAYDGMGLGQEHPQLGVIPQQYGKALLGAGQPAAAVPMFERSIAFHEHKFGLHHEHIPENLLDIAEAFKQMGRGIDERLPLLDRAVAIRDLSSGWEKDRNEAGLAQALQIAAECCEEAGHLAGAEARWAKCVAAATKVSACVESDDGEPDKPLDAVSKSYVHSSAVCLLRHPCLIKFECGPTIVQAYGSDHPYSQLASSRLEALRRFA